MSGFMQRPEERPGKVGRVIARRQAAVTGTNSIAEWMCRFIQPAGLEVEADRLRRCDGELPLRINWIVASQDGNDRPASAVVDGRDQRHEFPTQIFEDP